MKRVILMTALFAFALFSANAHPTPNDPKIGQLTGVVVDAITQEPIPFATVVVKSKADGSILKGGITEENGSFSITDLPDGPLLVEIQFIGYKTHSQEVDLKENRRKVDLGSLALEEASEQLEEVEVTAERTTIEQKIDRKVINVGKDLTTAGATASDIMNNIPSVNVDQQTGDLSLRGNSNVRVMVDGKLSNIPVAQLLRQIPSSSIKSIELITNPSAKYNPEGMSGIINIILHKDANIGFNGSFNTGLTVGEEAKFSSSIDLNYRHGKWNFYGNYGNNIGKYVNNGWIYRYDQNSEQQFNFKNNDKSHLYKVGVDFFLNDRNTFSIFTNQNHYNGKGDGQTDILYFDDPSLDQTQYFHGPGNNHGQQYNFDFKHDFAKEGHNIELEVDYNRFNSENDAEFRFTGNAVQPDYDDFVDTQRTQTIANLDYVNPLDSISKLEAGLEARTFETDVDYNSTGYSFDENGNLVPTPSTNFVYGMDIYSAYATFGQQLGKWSYQAGLRAETVTVEADTNGIRSFTDKYTELYPSGFLTYSPSEKNQFQVSVSRRVDRPGLQQVNPIREWSTPLISSNGNPELKPQFTWSYELNYTYRFEKGSVTSGVFYRSIHDEISRAVYVDRLDLNKLILSYDNFDDTSAYGIELSTNYRPFKWWSINGSFDLYSQTQRGFTETLDPNVPNPGPDDILTEAVEVENEAWNLRLNSSFTVTKTITLQLFGFYRGQNQNLQFEVNPMYFVNAGARYSFAQGRGTLSLNFNDIFNTMNFSFDGDRPYKQKGKFNWESKNVYVGLNYQFGSGKNRAAKRKNRDDNTKESEGGIL